MTSFEILYGFYCGCFRYCSPSPQMVRMSSTTRPHSTLSQLGRTSHVTEFIPRQNSSPNSSVSSLSSSPFSSQEEADLISNDSLVHSPTHSASPISHDIAANSNGSIVPAYQEYVGDTTYFYQFMPEHNGGQSFCMVDLGGEAPVPVPITTYYAIPIISEPSFFIAEELWNDILNRNVLTLLQSDPVQYPYLPQEVDSYHELYPLEPISNQVLHNVHLGYQASMYKATHIKSGIHYCLRRIHGFRLQNSKCHSVVDMWKKLNHPNIVQLKEVFTTKAFGDNSLVFVYSYYPGSETLLNKHISINQPGYMDPFTSDKNTPMFDSYKKNNLLRHQQNNKLPESLIWNYIIQLTSALRLIHSNALACRSLDPTKIVLTSQNRLRLSCLGMMDVVLHDNNSTINHLALVHHYQQEDLTALGKLVLALACKSTVAVRENISTALDIVSRTYTRDLRNFIMYLLTNQKRSVADLIPMIGARFYTQLDDVHNQIDTLENELSKDVQNGRLCRLITKLATINERFEFNKETKWSETGDWYMLKLFRDYVFHQVTENGQPRIDMAHIVQCLNKFDVGVPEKIWLVSRDEQSILLVSYAELKHCLEQSCQELSGDELATVDKE